MARGKKRAYKMTTKGKRTKAFKPLFGKKKVKGGKGGK